MLCAFPGQISILEKLNNKTKTKCGFSTIKLFNASNDIHFWRELRFAHTFGVRAFNICTICVQASPIRFQPSPFANAIAPKQMLRHGINVESVMYTDASKVLSPKVFNRCLVVVVAAEVDATALNEFPYSVFWQCTHTPIARCLCFVTVFFFFPFFQN